MATPSTSLATPRPDLSGSLEEFGLAADRQGFIAQRVLSVIDVAAQGGKFGRIPIEQLLQTCNTDRASGSGYGRSNFTFKSETFATEEHGHEEPVDDRDAAIYADYFDHELIATQRARDVVLRNQEIRTAALLFNTTTFTSQTTTVSVSWSTQATAVPIVNVETAVQAAWARTGIWPNALILNRLEFRNLRNVESIIDRINSSGAGTPSKPTDVTAAMLAAVFDLEHIIVAGSGKNTANEGQTASFGSIWSSGYAMVTRVGATLDIREPCIGRILHWGEDGSEIGGYVETYRDEVVRSDVVRCRHEVQEKLLYIECAQLIDLTQ